MAYTRDTVVTLEVLASLQDVAREIRRRDRGYDPGPTLTRRAIDKVLEPPPKTPGQVAFEAFLLEAGNIHHRRWGTESEVSHAAWEAAAEAARECKP